MTGVGDREVFPFFLVVIPPLHFLLVIFLSRFFWCLKDTGKLSKNKKTKRRRSHRKIIKRISSKCWKNTNLFHRKNGRPLTVRAQFSTWNESLRIRAGPSFKKHLPEPHAHTHSEEKNKPLLLVDDALDGWPFYLQVSWWDFGSFLWSHRNGEYCVCLFGLGRREQVRGRSRQQSNKSRTARNRQEKEPQVGNIQGKKTSQLSKSRYLLPLNHRPSFHLVGVVLWLSSLYR